MNNVKTIQAETERHAKAMVELIGQLKNHILSLPDNPRIKRLGNRPNCFTISSKDLGSNWSVEHHDFKKQYEFIVKELETSDHASVFNKFNKIISDEKLVKSTSSGWQRCCHTLNLHPEVVAHLRKLSEMSPKTCPKCHGEREWSDHSPLSTCHSCNTTSL
jgi:hypothetical protein